MRCAIEGVKLDGHSIQEQQRCGVGEACAVRLKPILLTALAAMIGAATVLPIRSSGVGDFAVVRSGVVDAPDGAS